MTLSAIALAMAACFVVFALGHRLHAELLAFPIILLALAQIVGLWSNSSKR